MTFRKFFGHTKAILGESTFEGSNELQMKKFQVVWKVDLNKFPMGYHEINLDVGKAPRRDLKVELCIGQVALCIGQIFHKMAIFLCFDCVHGFSLMEDVLLMYNITWLVNMMDN